MKARTSLLLLGPPSLLLLVSSIPLQHLNIHLRQLPPAVQITWVTSLTTIDSEVTTTTFDVLTISDTTAGSVETPEPTQQEDTGAQTPFLMEPSVPLPITSISAQIPVSTAFQVQTNTLSDIITSPFTPSTTSTLSVLPITVTNTITVSTPFTATPGSFWSPPANFQNLDAFKVAHFACGQQNLQITSGMSPNTTEGDDSGPLGIVAGLDSDVQTDMESLPLFGQSSDNSTNISSSALQLHYPASSIDPGNSDAPLGGADFYATPLPLADASNVTLSYSVFFPEGFDWVKGGKLPGLYGGHMTCSGGDDAASCFSTRLMWRAEGAGELYLYAPKDKQTEALCNAPPQSVCDAAYGLSIGRGSFRFTPGAWTTVRQTVTLNTPGEQDGGFSLEVNGELIMDRSDVFYRDVPSVTTAKTTKTSTGVVQTSTDVGANSNGDSNSGDGGLLSPLLDPLHSVGVPEGILPPIGKDVDSSQPISTSTVAEIDYPATERPPLLPFQISLSGAPTTDDAASALIFNLTASRSGMGQTLLASSTATQAVTQPTVTITNYLWAHAFDSSGKEGTVSGLADSSRSNSGDQGGNKPKPIEFSGLFFSTFFGGNSEEYATPTDQYSWFRDFTITINS